MLFDLAVADPKNARRHLESAQQALDYITEDLDEIIECQERPESMAHYEYAAQAVLREFEIPMWLAASKGEVPRFDYAGGIIAGIQAIKKYGQTQESRAKVSEFLPTLLFERAARRNVMPRHVGRMAMFREDCRPPVRGMLSRNWDCGFSPADSQDATDFISPPHKLQVKMGKTRASSYASHIAVVSASNFHFADAEKILETCLQEEGLESAFDAEPYREDQMDHLTRGIREILLDPSKSGHPFRMI